MTTGLRFISRVVYRLKRRYGQPIDILWNVSSTTHLETGKKTVQRGLVKVSRGIVLPSKIHREFFYDLVFIASNKNFTYGGQTDTTERRLIIDRKDLPSLEFEIKVGYWLIIDGKRYDVKDVEEFEQRTAYFIRAKQDVSSERSAVFEVSVSHALGLNTLGEGVK